MRQQRYIITRNKLLDISTTIKYNTISLYLLGYFMACEYQGRFMAVTG